MLKRTLILSIISLILIACGSGNLTKTTPYLAKPTGQYGVGFQDFYWVNKDLGIDSFYTGNNDDFSSDNQENHYHEIITRVYYPTNEHNTSPFYNSEIQFYQNSFNIIMKQIPGLITPEQIQEVSTLRSYSVPNALIIPNKRFPVILFSPGYTSTAEHYENFITELVSQGYIVCAISSPFINPVSLVNGHIVQPSQNSGLEDIDKRFQPLQEADLEFTFNEIHVLHNSNPIFSAMDLLHIGAFGHSLGGKTVADIAHKNSYWFQAAATLDLHPDLNGDSLKEFKIPFMHEISAERNVRSRWSGPSEYIHDFNLGKNGYLVTLSPNNKDWDYSKHDDFSNSSTYEFMPVFQAVYDYAKKQGNPEVGSGSGWDRTNAINTYLVKFFNTYLKNQVEEKFNKCEALPIKSYDTKDYIVNTYMQCGQSVINPIKFL
jgi:hypothetical protein